MQHIYVVKLLHALIFSLSLIILLYMNQMYFAIGIAIFAILTYPTKTDFIQNEDKYNKNFADIDAVLKDHEKALTEIINRLKN